MARSTLETWRCRKCGRGASEAVPYFQTIRGTEYIRCYCKECDNKGRGRYRRQPSSHESEVARRSRIAEQRRNPTLLQRAQHILNDSKKSDRRRGRTTQLSISFIMDAISRPCDYCGGTDIKMTLDRIDNDRGHIEDNVVPCCLRCNVTRGTMPYSAWVFVAKGMRQALRQGLFGDWTGATAGNKKKSEDASSLPSSGVSS